MPTNKAAPRKLRSASGKYNDNLKRRGNVPVTSRKKKEDEGSNLGPVLIGILLFVVVGSAIVQIFQSSQQSLQV